MASSASFSSISRGHLHFKHVFSVVEWDGDGADAVAATHTQQNVKSRGRGNRYLERKLI
jgi:hypothetical protein